MNVILYTTHCPMCKMVEQRLNSKKINYVENTNVEEMEALGITHVPALKVDEILYRDTKTILNFINKR